MTGVPQEAIAGDLASGISDDVSADRHVFTDSDVVVDVCALADLRRGVYHSPIIDADGCVTLSFAGTPGATITVAGSFNNWDPFTHRLRERTPGIYETTVRLLPGRYYYVFIVGGKKKTDPLNDQTALDPSGLAVSTFYIPQRS